MSHIKDRITTLRRRYEHELFENVLPFWLRYAPDRVHGGHFNCLDRDGTVYDSTKHMWLQGRLVWMFSTLYRMVEPRPAWLETARLGMEFLTAEAWRPEDGRVYFSLTAEGKPIYLQRKIFSECFYVMALSAYSRAAGVPRLLDEAQREFARIWEWAWDSTKVGRPAFAGETPRQSLAVPMILLNVIEELTGGDPRPYAREIDECLQRLRRHVHPDQQLVFEHVRPDGTCLDSPEGRLLNPGHAIEAGWFIQHWAQRLRRRELQDLAVDIVRWSFATGWDREYGGLYYFLDARGYSPTQLEWSMKLWWPHCETLYATLLNWSLTRAPADWDMFGQVDRYTFDHFPDPQYGEWYGYLDRRGEVSQRFKGGPYKGAFHVPRALWLCWRLLKQLEDEPTCEKGCAPSPDA